MPRSQKLSENAIDICPGQGFQHARYPVMNSCRGLRRPANSPTPRIYPLRQIITFNIPGSFQAYSRTAQTGGGISGLVVHVRMQWRLDFSSRFGTGPDRAKSSICLFRTAALGGTM